MTGEIPNFAPSYNIPPMAREPIIRMSPGGERIMSIATWDYRDQKVTTLKGRPPFYNAQGEKFKTSAAFATRRCLVPVNGFYEWVTINGAKQAFVFMREDRRSFAMGGVWNTWSSQAADIELTYVELTVAPNKLVGEIHNRMPLLIDEPEWETWLSGPPGEAGGLVRTNPMQGFIRYPVGPSVNSVHNDSPALIEPFELPEPDQQVLQF